MLDTFPSKGRVSARVIDGYELLSLLQRTGQVKVTVMTPWMPVVNDLPLAAPPEDDDMLIIGSKSSRKRLGVDVMVGLRDNVLNGSSNNTNVISADQVAQAALDKGNVEVEQQRVVQVGQGSVALEGVQAGTGKSRVARTGG